MTKDYTHIAEMCPVTALRVDSILPFAEGSTNFRGQEVLYTLFLPRLDEATIEDLAEIQAGLALAERNLGLATTADQDPSISQATMLRAVRGYRKHQVSRELWGPGKHMPAFRAELTQFYGPQSTVVVPGYALRTSQTQDDRFVTAVEPLAKQDRTVFTALLRTQGLQGKVMFWQ